MIQTTAGQIERALKTLSLSNIAYVDFESGYYRSRSDFDLDRFTISNNIAESTELQKTIAKLSQKEKLLIL
jgi:hypothetical protein